MPSISNLFASDGVRVIRPCKIVRHGHRDFVEVCEKENATFYGVYISEGLEERWLADFDTYADARRYVTGA